MVTNCNGRFLESTANFLINIVEVSEGINPCILDKFPFMNKIYNDYIRSRRKGQLVGSVQYIPTDVWALVMVDSIKNNNIFAYDTQYQYIVNIFTKCQIGDSCRVCLDTMTKALTEVKTLAENISASSAIIIDGTYCNVHQLNKIIRNIFADTDVPLEIYLGSNKW